MKTASVFIDHILDSISNIEIFVAGYSLEKFLDDMKTQEAVIRQLELIGEASTHLEAGFKTELPNIPWADIKGMRNHLIHEYWDINLEDVWQTINQDIPLLKQALQNAK